MPVLGVLLIRSFLVFFHLDNLLKLLKLSLHLIFDDLNVLIRVLRWVKTLIIASSLLLIGGTFPHGTVLLFWRVKSVCLLDPHKVSEIPLLFVLVHVLHPAQVNVYVVVFIIRDLGLRLLWFII